jgi:hypothetical protein
MILLDNIFHKTKDSHGGHDSNKGFDGMLSKLAIADRRPKYGQ